MKISIQIALLLTLSMLAGDCELEPGGFSGVGKVPIYLPESELSKIENLPPQAIGETGTIFFRDSLFFMLEQKKGIHVFVFVDSSSTHALTFLKIPAITDFTLAGNYLYADSWKDLVTLDIGNLLEIKEINRQKGVFQPPLFPPLFNGPFECVDESKGAVIGWRDSVLVNVQCQTF